MSNSGKIALAAGAGALVFAGASLFYPPQATADRRDCAPGWYEYWGDLGCMQVPQMPTLPAGVTGASICADLHSIRAGSYRSVVDTEMDKLTGGEVFGDGPKNGQTWAWPVGQMLDPWSATMTYSDAGHAVDNAIYYTCPEFPVVR